MIADQIVLIWAKALARSDARMSQTCRMAERLLSADNRYESVRQRGHHSASWSYSAWQAGQTSIVS